MKNKMIVLVSTLLLFFIFTVFFRNTLPAISYFPIDQKAQFEYAKTKLLPPVHANPEGDYRIDWTTHSKSQQTLYLRQDVSLLFHNGKLKGIQNTWKQKTAAILMTKYPVFKDPGLLDAITFHHGEIHDNTEAIRSMQTMTAAKLYVHRDDEKPTKIVAFSKPKNRIEAMLQKQLDSETKQDLLYHWNALVSHFKLDLTHYATIPLTSLAKYANEPLPGMDQSKTDKIIGQLWEGLYKQYVMKALTSKKANAYMPLILIDQKSTHLMILFELNGKREQLIQRF